MKPFYTLRKHLRLMLHDADEIRDRFRWVNWEKAYKMRMWQLMKDMEG